METRQPLSLTALAESPAASTSGLGERATNPRFPAFAVFGLVARYGKKQVLRVEKAICPQIGVTVLVGPSGCGKSSFMKILANLMEPDLTYVGHVWDFGVERGLSAGDQAASAALRYAMVWQTPVVFPCSILENLTIPLKKRGVAKSGWRAMIEESLAAVGLLRELGPGWAAVQANRISGGQMQRLCIARCLLQDSRVILLDEPCSSLDPVSTDMVESVIASLAENRPVILVTHNLGQARRLGSYAAVFCVDEAGGYVCENGAALECLHDPQSQAGRMFILREVGGR